MQQYDAYFQQAGQQYNVDPALLRAVALVESGGNPRATSPVGAQGLTQIMPATARSLGVQNPYDPRQAIHGTAKLLDENLRRYGNVQDAVLAYHGGTDQANWGPKTQDYLRKVSAAYGGAMPKQQAQQDDAFARDFGDLSGGENGSPVSVDPFTRDFGDMASAPTPAAKATPDVLPEARAIKAGNTPAAPAAAPRDFTVGEAVRQAWKSGPGAALDALGSLARGEVRGVSDVLDAPSEWLAAGAEKSGLTGLLARAGINMPTAEQQRETNKADRAEYEASNPGMAGKVGRFGGNVAGVMAPIAGAETAIASGGNRLLGALSGSPKLAEGVAAAGRFLGGQGGLLSKVAYGAEQGAAGGALLSGGSDDSLGRQMVTGAVVGGVAAPLVAGASNLVGKIVPRNVSDGAVQQRATQVMDDFAAKLQSEGSDISQYPQSILAKVREQVADSLKAGKLVDPAAVARSLEFEAVGVKPTLGQVTRDPVQFTTERNMAGLKEAGAPLAQRFSEQNNQLLNTINGMGAKGAQEADVAGGELIKRLQAIDAPKSAAVNDAYSAARGAGGRYADLDVPAFSQATNDALDEQMLGRFLPGEVKGLLNDISAGKIPLNVNTAVQADSVMSAAQRAASARGDNAAAKAISVVRDKLNATPIADSAGDAAKAQFDFARGLARDRFAEIEGTPALKAALSDASPDSFVRRYIIGGDARDVQALAKYIGNDPRAKEVARQQIADFLQAKGFGSNGAGDNLFRADSYNKALDSIGTNKLKAFFDDAEVAKLNSIGRVGAYINSRPAGSSVNSSNTGAAVMNLFGEISGNIGRWPGVNVLRDTFRTFADERAAGAALAAKIPEQAVPLSAGEQNRLLQLLAPLSQRPDDARKKNSPPVKPRPGI